MTRLPRIEVKRKRNISRLRQTQGCLTDCVAYILNVHPARVPYFVYPRKDWCRRLKRYFHRRGFCVRWRMCARIPRRGTYIVSGNSLRWKTAAHVVVYRNGRLAYDPQYPSKWSEKRVTHRLVMVQAV